MAHTYAPTPTNYVANVPLATPTSAPTEASSLSTGAIVGISIAVFVVAVIILSVVLYLRSAKFLKKSAPPESAPLVQRPTPGQMDAALGRGASASAGTQTKPPGSRPTVVAGKV